MPHIGYMTHGIAQLTDAQRLALVIAFHRQSKLEDDWFYSLETAGVKAYACKNEAGSYTLMLPEEY